MSPTTRRRTRSHRRTSPRTDNLVLLPLPPRAGRRVFEHDAAGVKIVANLVGAGELFVAASIAAFADEPLNLSDRHGRLFILRTPQVEDAENTVEVVERRMNSSRVVGPERALIERHV